MKLAKIIYCSRKWDLKAIKVSNSWEMATYLYDYSSFPYVLMFFFSAPGPSTPVEPSPPPMKKRDFTLKELKELGDGTREDGRILVAVNGKVYDVTKGKRFYGSGKQKEQIQSVKLQFGSLPAVFHQKRNLFMDW